MKIFVYMKIAVKTSGSFVERHKVSGNCFKRIMVVRVATLSGIHHWGGDDDDGKEDCRHNKNVEIVGDGTTWCVTIVNRQKRSANVS